MGAWEDMNNGDFAFYIADIFVESVQYGQRVDLCELLNPERPFFGYLDVIHGLAQKQGVNPSDYCRNNLKKEALSNARSWTYQYCTEFGWFQTPSHEHPLRSQNLLGLPYWLDYCNEIFGTKLSIDRSKAEFGG